MLTVGHLLRELLPDGTGRGRGVTWRDCPAWPPDLFAVVGTIAAMSGCYAEPGIVLSRNGAERADKLANAASARELGTQWRHSGVVPRPVQAIWASLVVDPTQAVCASSGDAVAWKRAAMRLLAVADEAGAGFGFAPQPGRPSLRTLAFAQLLAAGSGGDSSLRLPDSLAFLVPPERACIMPKSLTPNVGCTVRSLSHNLALLPGRGAVRPRWFIAASANAAAPGAAPEPDGRFNVLLVPYPYVIDRSDIRLAVPPDPGQAVEGYFAFRQGWLRPGGKRMRPGKFVEALVRLVDEARAGAGTIHAVVLPETALDPSLADAVADGLARRFPELELLVCGVLRETDGRMRNQAMLAHLQGAAGYVPAVQNKHHRWKLEEQQIARYRLGGTLDPSREWWESIDVGDREIVFALGRHDTVFAALICEDLARFDPVLPVLNSVGPNLVVALLQDGPQLIGRWPGRYATVLAEDPGSSVLTLTSLGMIRLSTLAHEAVRPVIGLWKEAGGQARELSLPGGAHALTLCLRRRRISRVTMDLRHDRTQAVSLSFHEARPVTWPDAPAWLERM